VTYTLCDGKPANYCPASGLCEDLRLTMWAGIVADRAHEGEDRREAVSAAIGEAATQAGLQASRMDVARLAMSTMHIADGNCPHNKVSS
jgi:hypothetical protein